MAIALAIACQYGVAHAAPAPGTVAVSKAAYAAADAGYKSYARGDYATAEENAQEAVRLAPGKREYWLLLAQAQLALGRLPEAAQSLERAERATGDEAALVRLRADVLRAQAQAAGDAMYKALAAGDLRLAIENGERAVQADPEHPAYRLVLIHALLRDRRYAEAERVADQAVARHADDAAALALRAYARQGLGRQADATADAQGALQHGSRNPASERDLRLVAADLALAQGSGERVFELLRPLPAEDAEAHGRRDWARQEMGAAQPRFALPVPGIDCTDAAAAGTCALKAASAPPLPGHADASTAYAAMQQRDYAGALQHAQVATAASPAQREWQLLHMNAALGAGDLREAERAATAAIALDPKDGQTLAQRSVVRRQLGRVDEADADAQAALQTGTLPPARAASLLVALGRREEARRRLRAAGSEEMTSQERLDTAYAAVNAQDDEAALLAFRQAEAKEALPSTALLDAGYAAMRANQDAEALGYLDRAVQAAQSGQLEASPQRVYDTRRTAAEVERRWGVLASVTYRNGAGVEPGFGAVGSPGDQRTTQGGVEAYWRPWGYRNAQYVEVFARGFATLDARQPDVWTGRDSFQGGVGARWKPFTAQNLVLSMSRVFGPNVTDSWLAQAGYSLDIGGDVRLDVPSWWTTRTFAEVGRYFGNNTQAGSYGLASVQAGRSFLVGTGGRTVVFPHVFAGVEHRSRDPVARTSSGIGPGVGLRQWFREDTTRGPRSYWELTLQYRVRLSGDDRLKGPYLNLTLSY